MKYRKKLIEVALPLDAINKASVRESFIYRGNPSALHKWWAQRPLAAARAVIFAQMIDDPSEYIDSLRMDPKLRSKAETALRARLKLWEESRDLVRKAEGSGLQIPEPGPAPTLDDVLADQERQRLFQIIENLVSWENTTNETILEVARNEIWKSWHRACTENVDHPRADELFDRNHLPPFHDPFAGGGTLPLEAQRLGLHSWASDLNPVSVLINKAMVEFPPKFAGKAPVNPEASGRQDLIKDGWSGVLGLADDVRYYGQWLREEAEKRIGDLYPDVEVTEDQAAGRSDLGQSDSRKLPVIAYIWTRTVKSPNPAFAQIDVPLASTFLLSSKVGREAYVKPVVDANSYRFRVEVGNSEDARVAKNGTKLAGANFVCILSGAPISGDYIKAEGKAGRIGARLMAIVAEGERGRVYLSPTPAMETLALQATPEWKPDVEFFQQALGFRVGNYGMKTWSDLFTTRQLVAMTTFSDLVPKVRDRVKRDALASGQYDDDGLGLSTGGLGAQSYADAISVYLAFSLSKASDYNCSLVPWYTKEDRPGHLFSQQAIPMVWDYAELNPFAKIGGGLMASVGIVAGALGGCAPNGPLPRVEQLDALATRSDAVSVVSTDPPYYDNVPYADLSDFFYVWLRSSLRNVFPELFTTVCVPKAEELVATPYRHGGKDKANAFFMTGMTNAMHRLAELAHPAFPVTIYYAFKQAESNAAEGTASTGWETFLGAVIRSGFAIAGTWPMRTERGNRMRGIGSNALATSIVLVCHPRPVDAKAATRRDFVTALKQELPLALAHLQRGNIAPVDLAQAAIGPGMAVYSRFATVLDAEGKPVSVREALALINQTLDESLAEQEGDFDADSRWALAWFELSGFEEDDFGIAEQLSKAKNTSVQGLEEGGILVSSRGKVRLLRPSELTADWDPFTDRRLTAWEMVHQLIRSLESGGERQAAILTRKLGSRAEVARELCYRLYTLCERKKRANEALSYNALVQSWPEITRLSREKTEQPTQGGLFEEIGA